MSLGYIETNVDNDEITADKVIDSIKFYTLSKNNKKVLALKHYLMAKQNYEELKLNIPRVTSINTKLISVIKKLIILKSTLSPKESDVGDKYNDLSLNELYLRLAKLSLESNDQKEVISCYDKIINIFVKEATTTKMNFTFTPQQILELLRNLMETSYYCHSLCYCLKVIDIFAILIGTFDVISELNIIIATCYFNLSDYDKCAVKLEEEYNKTTSFCEGILTEQKKILNLMIIAYALHNTNIARKKFEFYITNQSKTNQALGQFIRFLELRKFIEARELLLKEFECINQKTKTYLIEALERERSSVLLKTSSPVY
jgi:tetratricopeptide (TPR) repeat protein